jgi:hypothetical protein
MKAGEYEGINAESAERAEQSNGNDARLKSKSRRPLQSQNQRRLQASYGCSRSAQPGVAVPRKAIAG